MTDAGPDRALSRTETLERFRAMRGKYPRAADLLDAARGVERGYPNDVLADIAAGTETPQ